MCPDGPAKSSPAFRIVVAEEDEGPGYAERASFSGDEDDEMDADEEGQQTMASKGTLKTERA